jgi:hypothetical protein
MGENKESLLYSHVLHEEQEIFLPFSLFLPFYSVILNFFPNKIYYFFMKKRVKIRTEMPTLTSFI